VAAGFIPEANGVGAVNQLISGIVGAVLGLWLFDLITTNCLGKRRWVEEMLN